MADRLPHPTEPRSDLDQTRERIAHLMALAALRAAAAVDSRQPAESTSSGDNRKRRAA